MKFTVDGHVIKIDRYIRTLTLEIDGILVDKIVGFGQIFNKDVQLHGTIEDDDGASKEITVHVENSNGIATVVTLLCDGEKCGEGILI